MASLAILSQRAHWRRSFVTLQQSRSVTIGLVGGSGFIGYNAAVRLTDAGYNVRIISRAPQKIKRHTLHQDIAIEEGFATGSRFKSNSGLGSIMRKTAEAAEESGTMDDGGKTKYYMEFHRASIRAKGDNEELRRALSGCDGVINLVGVLAEGFKRGGFDDLHHKGAASVASLAKEVGVKRFVQMSAIGASTESDSKYARSKAHGEEAVLREFPGATILRPSVVVGKGDGFFCFFDKMSRCSPMLPLVGGGSSKFQPVHVDDVAESLIAVLASRFTVGNTYELGGPEVLTFKEMLQKLLAYQKKWRLLMPIPYAAAHVQASVLQCLPGKLLTNDQVRMLKRDNVVSSSALAFKDLGMTDLLTVQDALEDSFKFRPYGF